MQEIWKWVLPVQAEFELEMPVFPQLLTVQLQDNTPVLWAIVSPEMTKEGHKFYCVGTGHEFIDHNKQYIGTVQDGPLVLHYFMEKY